MGAFVRADGLAASDARNQRGSGSTMCVTMAGDGRGTELTCDEGLMLLVCHLSAVRYTESREAFLSLVNSSIIRIFVAHSGIFVLNMLSWSTLPKAGRKSADYVSWLGLR